MQATCHLAQRGVAAALHAETLEDLRNGASLQSASAYWVRVPSPRGLRGVLAEGP